MESQEGLIAGRVEDRIQARLAGLNLSAQEIEKRRQEYTAEIRNQILGRSSTSLLIHFSDGSRLEARSFDEAAAHPQALQSTVKSFALDVACGAISARIEAGSGFDPSLAIEVSPSNYEPARTLFAALRRWARGVTPARWQQVWRSVVFTPFIPWMVWVVLLFSVWGVSMDSQAKYYYRDQAHRLIQNGVTPDKQQKALETMLALQSEYPAPVQYPIGHWFWLFLLTGTVATAILAHPPNLEVGIGRGEDRVVRWQKWMRAAFVFVPTFLASNFLWPLISDFIKKYAMR